METSNATLEMINRDALECSMRLEPLDESAYYSISNCHDLAAAHGMIRRCMDLHIWMMHVPENEEDFELYARKMSSTFRLRPRCRIWHYAPS